MPPKPKFTKDDFIEAAIDIIRESSVENITAQAIAKKMHTSTRPMFNYFAALEELRAAAAERAREIYNAYAENGLAMTPAFKGFAMEYVRFAMEEPSLFRLLFMRKTENADMTGVLSDEGHLEKVLNTITETFDIERRQAVWLYENLWLFAHGMATMCACEAVKFTDEVIAEKFGTLCRSLVITLNMPKDERTKVIPKKDHEMPGSVEDYVYRKNF